MFRYSEKVLYFHNHHVRVYPIVDCGGESDSGGNGDLTATATWWRWRFEGDGDMTATTTWWWLHCHGGLTATSMWRRRRSIADGDLTATATLRRHRNDGDLRHHDDGDSKATTTSQWHWYIFHKCWLNIDSKSLFIHLSRLKLINYS